VARWASLWGSNPRSPGLPVVLSESFGPSDRPLVWPSSRVCYMEANRTGIVEKGNWRGKWATSHMRAELSRRAGRFCCTARQRSLERSPEVQLMAQFLRSVLYPNSSHQREQHLQHDASSSSSAPTPHQWFAYDSASGGADNPLQHDGAARYNKPATTFMKTDSEKVYVAEFMDAVSIPMWRDQVTN
jgi:hypothetical protein